MMPTELDQWLDKPAFRVAHQRRSSAGADELWAAARSVTLNDTQLLGRLVRWRIPGTPGQIAFDDLFRRAPFLVLEDGEHSLVAGLVGRIWTLRRDYPKLENPTEFRSWSAAGTARVVFAHWVEPVQGQGAALCSEVRVQAFGAQGRIGLATVRPVVRAFQHLIGTDGITAAVRRAENG